MNLYAEAEYSSMYVIDDFSDKSIEKYKEFEIDYIRSYLEANNDEQTAMIREDADNISDFIFKFIETKKEN